MSQSKENPLGRAGWLLLLMTAAILLYWSSTRYAPFFDDIYFFQQNGLNRIFQQGFAFEIRWLPYFLTAWVDLIFDDNVFAQRMINVILHAINAYLLYALIKQLGNHVAPHDNNERGARLAALIFLAHPIAVYAVGYLIQRTIVMATLFGLLALNTYFDGLITRKRAYFVFSALFYLLAVFSKEHAVLLPFAALALTPLAEPPSRALYQRTAFGMALYLPVIVLVLASRLGFAGKTYEPLAEPLVNELQLGASPAMLWLLSIMTQAALYFRYLGLMLFPNPEWMSIDMRVPFALNPWEFKYLAAITALAVYGVAAALLLVRRGPAGLMGYGLLAPLLLFIVEFAAVRIQEPFVLYRAYLWLPFFLILVPCLTNSLPARSFWPVSAAVIIALSLASSDRLNSFANHFSLWNDAVTKLPSVTALGSARAHSNRCQQQLRKGRLDEAISDCSNALRADPTYRLAYQNRAYAYLKSGKFPEALGDAQAVARMFPQDPHIHAVIGDIYKSSGDRAGAETHYAIACNRRSIAGCFELAQLKNQSIDVTAK